LTVRLIYANTNLLFSATAGVLRFLLVHCRGRCPHRPAVLTLATSSRVFYTNLQFRYRSVGTLSVRPERCPHTASCVPNIHQIKDLGCLCKDALKSTYGSLDNHSLCRRIVSKALRKRTFEPLTLSTLEDAFHSLRQYLGCGFTFGYASRVLLYFRLYCSLANQFKFNLYFTYCSLEYRKS